MEKKEKESKFVLHKAKADMPDTFDLQLRQERMVETQKQAYIKLHHYRDRLFTGEGKIKSFSHISGKMWFLDDKGKLDHMDLRIDIETAIMIDTIFSGTITVQKYSIFHNNKVVAITDYEEESSEMESIQFRTYSFTAVTFPLLTSILSSYFNRIWMATIGLPENYQEEMPNYTMDGWDEPILEEYYKLTGEEDDDVMEDKNKLLGALKAAYNKNVIPLISGSKLYTVQPGVAMSGSKKEKKE